MGFDFPVSVSLCLGCAFTLVICVFVMLWYFSLAFGCFRFAGFVCLICDFVVLFTVWLLAMQLVLVGLVCAWFVVLIWCFICCLVCVLTLGLGLMFLWFECLFSVYVGLICAGVMCFLLLFLVLILVLLVCVVLMFDCLLFGCFNRFSLVCSVMFLLLCFCLLCFLSLHLWCLRDCRCLFSGFVLDFRFVAFVCGGLLCFVCLFAFVVLRFAFAVWMIGGFA